MTVPQKMLEMLSDGLPHSRHELQGCLWDELASLTAVQFHMSKLRKRLAPDRGISCERLNGETYYRLVEITSSQEAKAP